MSILNLNTNFGQVYLTIFLFCDCNDHSVSLCRNCILTCSINTSLPNLMSRFFRLLEIN